EQFVVGVDSTATVVHDARSPRAARQARTRHLVRVQPPYRLRHPAAVAGLDDDAAVVRASDFSDFAVRFDSRDEGPASSENAVELARHDEPGKTSFQRHDEDIGRWERFVA